MACGSCESRRRRRAIASAWGRASRGSTWDDSADQPYRSRVTRRACQDEASTSTQRSVPAWFLATTRSRRRANYRDATRLHPPAHGPALGLLTEGIRLNGEFAPCFDREPVDELLEQPLCLLDAATGRDVPRRRRLSIEPRRSAGRAVVASAPLRTHGRDRLPSGTRVLPVQPDHARSGHVVGTATPTSKCSAKNECLTCVNADQAGAVAVGFEPTEAVNLTRFRGVLLWPLGHTTWARLGYPPRGGHPKRLRATGGRGSPRPPPPPVPTRRPPSTECKRPT